MIDVVFSLVDILINIFMFSGYPSKSMESNMDLTSVVLSKIYLATFFFSPMMVQLVPTILQSISRR